MHEKRDCSSTLQVITQALARDIRVKDPQQCWRTVIYSERCVALNTTNAWLASEGIPEVSAAAFSWRMGKVLGNLKHSQGELNTCCGSDEFKGD
jgi:hypothetical protein